jgi:putative hydrolase of the HAD superfamily
MKVAVPFDFTIPTLEELRRSYKIGLITNGNHDIQAKKIEMLEIMDLFDEIMISDDYGVRKPDTKLFEIMSEKLEIAPFEMLYVGDHPKNDIDASRNAGYIPVWVKTTGTWIFSDIEKPELQIETVAELPELLKTQMSDVIK